MGHMHAEPKMFQHDGSLDEIDPEIANIIKHEKKRQAGVGLLFLTYYIRQVVSAYTLSGRRCPALSSSLLKTSPLVR